MNALVYDLEIVKAVPMRGEAIVPEIQYCAGWDDHENMGISVIGCYDYAEDRYRVFCKDNFAEFEKLGHARELLVSFNGIGFDNKVLLANGIKVPDDGRLYDILRELWLADGLEPEFRYPSHTGYNLDKVARANFGLAKTGDGGLAPVDWQRGNIGSVIDYCLQDVKLTRRCFDLIVANGGLRSPKDSLRFLEMRKP